MLERIVKHLCPTATISVTTNGQEALQVYEQSGADLIISNNKMALMDGLRLTRTLRARGIAVPVIVTSGDPSVEMQAIKAGATLFLYKPQVMEQLPEILPNLLPL